MLLFNLLSRDNLSTSDELALVTSVMVQQFHKSILKTTRWTFPEEKCRKKGEREREREREIIDKRTPCCFQKRFLLFYFDSPSTSDLFFVIQIGYVCSDSYPRTRLTMLADYPREAREMLRPGQRWCAPFDLFLSPSRFDFDRSRE